MFQVAKRIWYLKLGLFFVVGLALLWRVETRYAFASTLKWGGILAIGLIAVIGLLVVDARQVWFVASHQVFFAPGTWMFDYSYTLIRLFPEKFWFDAALTNSGLSIAGGLLLALVGER